jgi:hypothetical protein
LTALLPPTSTDAAPNVTGAAGAASDPAPTLHDFAYTYAFDIVGAEEKAIAVARRLLATVSRGRLAPQYQAPLLRRLALGEWMKADRPRPARESTDRPARESESLRFFRKNWLATYDDLAVTLGISEIQARQIVHKARMELIYAEKRLHAAASECRGPRDLLSDLREGLLDDDDAAPVLAHLASCRACSTVDFNLRALLDRPPLPPLKAPSPVAAEARTLRIPFTRAQMSRRSRAIGVGLAVLGLILGIAELNPDFRARTQRGLDRVLGAADRAWVWADQRVEDARVLGELASSLLEGRGEDANAIVEEYLKSRESNRNGPDPANKSAPSPVVPTEGGSLEPPSK